MNTEQPLCICDVDSVAARKRTKPRGDRRAKLTDDKRMKLTGDRRTKLTGDRRTELTGDKLRRLTGDKRIHVSDEEESSELGRSVFELSFQNSSNV